MFFPLILVACLFGVGSANLSHCPSSLSGKNNVKFYGKSCYEFVVNEEKYFSDARDHCKDYGGDLALVKSQDVNNFLAHTLEKTYGIHSSPVWIGLQYFGSERKYRWVDGSLMSHYNNIDNRYAYENENCVALYPESGLWHEFKCNDNAFEIFSWSKKRFVCEYPATGLTTVTPTSTLRAPSTKLPDDWAKTHDCPRIVPRDTRVQVFHGICYMFIYHRLDTFSDAEKFCQYGGGSLAVVSSNTVDNFIQNQWYNTYHLRKYAAWIGLRYNPAQGSHFWLDGTPLKTENFRFQTFDKTKQCVAISAYDGKWLDMECQGKDSLPFVCEFETKPLSPPKMPPAGKNIKKVITKDDCPAEAKGEKNMEVFQHKCYTFEMLYLKTFKDAERYCKYGGGRLAVIKTKSVDTFLQDKLFYTYGLRDYAAWIGLHYNPKYHTYYWEDGTRLNTTRFFRHKTFRLTDECVSISAHDGKWLDKKCDGLILPYVCEYDPIPYSPQTSTARSIITTQKGSTSTALHPTTTTTSSTTTTTPTSTIKPTTITTRSETTTRPTTQTTFITSTTATPTTAPTTPLPTTEVKPPTTTATTVPSTTTKGQSTEGMKSSTSSPALKTTCPTIVCNLDCGLDGYKQNSETGCVLCQCDY